MLYGCDGHWWKINDGVPEFGGLKLSQDTDACTRYRDLHHVRLDREQDKLLVEHPGLIGGGGNSGFQALNLAVQFGARRIVLVGFDMRVDRGAHWHGNHAKGLNNPREHNMMKWRKVLNGAAGTLADLGVTVINASPVSTLTAFPFASLQEVMG